MENDGSPLIIYITITVAVFILQFTSSMFFDGQLIPHYLHYLRAFHYLQEVKKNRMVFDFSSADDVLSLKSPILDQ
ncbi:hypothetical protein KIN20_016411 [Parelaphostrongylus tenuis]|uniref:Uncharacterized protein n=1 Tax=Parelaphostrongylus tenuis TaxID=148309 RepID=A0AAD5MYI2_PARTN|nr:hypothetical protein KIN20_016411 [Parelaphostrongylus tenuis]